MALKPEPTAPFHSVHYVLRVLETVSKYGGGVTDVQIARETGLPTGHLAPMLSMLRREGYVEQVADGAYAIGDSLVLLGSGAARKEALEAKLQDDLTKLRDSVGAAVYMSRYIDGEIKVTWIADGPGACGGERVGGLPVRRARQRDREVPAHAVGPERAPGPSGAPQGGPLHVPHDHQ